MDKLSLREAVKHFDVSRPTLQKALKSGKLSGVQNGKGHWTIDHSPAYTAFLSALISVRKRAGFSQVALAAKLGKPASFVGKYELGERRLDVIEVMVILDALDCQFDQLSYAQKLVTALVRRRLEVA